MMSESVKTIMAAFSALSVMSIHANIPYRTLRELHKLRQVLFDETQIARNAIRDLVAQFDGDIGSGDIVTFPDADARDAYQTARDELLDTTIELPVNPVDLSSFADDITFQSMNADIESLSAFIIFEKGE